MNAPSTDELRYRNTFIGSRTVQYSLIFKGSVRKNRFSSAATDAEIENIAKDWFRFAKDRHGGHREREMKKIAEKGKADETSEIVYLNWDLFIK